jgi:glycosyltransferase involved in cell wall biosynthesis
MISFVWEWGMAKEIYPNCRDGITTAMKLLGKRVKWFLNEKPEDNDWILTWCDSNSEYSHFFTPEYKAKRAIILTTNPVNYHNLEGFDLVFCESSVVYNECRMRGLHAVRAFGTDDRFFVPGNLKKDIKYFYPATFSPWKLQSEIAYLGNKLLCIGTIQPNGQGEYDACVNAGVKTVVGYQPPEELLNYYQRAENVIIPAIHGSERTVLEAMSCNIWPLVTNEKNIKTRTYIEEYMEWRKQLNKTPREFILKNYTAQMYADKIIKAMEDYD